MGTHRKTALIWLLIPSLSVSLLACDWQSPYDDEGDYCGIGSWEVTPPPSQRAPDVQMALVGEVLPVEYTAIDLLFVIDDSRSMTEEQEQLGLWASEMFSVLSLDGELPDLHVAVVSSSLTIGAVSGCEAGGDGRFHTGGTVLDGDLFLRDVATPTARARNYQGEIGEAFAQMARVGETGCGYEQPFEAARIALSGQIPEHEGFLRDDALLVVVFVTDEDDCSMTDTSLASASQSTNDCSLLGASTSYRCFEFGVRCADGMGAREFGERENCEPDEQSPYLVHVGEFESFLSGLKEPGEVIVAGIYGKPHRIGVEPDQRPSLADSPRLSPACESASGLAYPAVRMNSLLSKFPARSAQSSICEPDLSWAMRNTAMITRDTARRSHCLRGAIADVDPTARGVQTRCSVTSAIDRRSRFADGEPIPECGAGKGERCFTIERDELECVDTQSQLSLRVQGGLDVPGETLTVRCEVDTVAKETQL